MRALLVHCKLTAPLKSGPIGSMDDRLKPLLQAEARATNAGGLHHHRRTRRGNLHLWLNLGLWNARAGADRHDYVG
jgi:hypothetical protein